MSNEIKALKTEMNQKIEKLAKDRASEIMLNSKDWTRLLDQVEKLEDDPYKHGVLSIDEFGVLVSNLDIDLGAIANEERETIDALVEELEQGGVYLYQSQYSQGKHECTASVCLGEPVIFNVSPERGHYAIYNEELGLKVDSVLSEEHGFALIEQAQRKAGIFESIVSTDYYGIPTLLSEPYGKLSDKELSDLIDKIESENEDGE